MTTATRVEAGQLAAIIATQQLVATSALDVHGIRALIAERMSALSGANGVGIARVEGAEIVFEAGFGSAATCAGLRLGLGTSLVGLSARLGEILECEDAKSDARADQDARRLPGLRSAIAVPLWDEGAVTGVLLVTAERPGAFTHRDAQVLQVLGGLLSSALTRAAAADAREQALVALRQSEARSRSVLAALHEGIVLFHANGTVQPVNASAVRLLERIAAGRPAAVERHPWQVTDEEGAALGADDFPPRAALRSGAATAARTIGIASSDGPIWIRMRCEPLRDHDAGEPETVVASLTDVTEERGAQVALREAKEAAEQASVAKSRFLANMSHELRTPLNSVIGFASVLLKSHGGDPGSDTTERSARDLTYLARIHDNGRHLLALINEVLDLSRIDAAGVTLVISPVDLAALVTESLAQLEAQRPALVELGAEIPGHLIPLETDGGRLRQIVLNLVGNALKFTERGRVTVGIEAGPDGRALRLSVADTGIGIAAERLAAVLEPFQQADDSTARRYGGTGLGLAITRSLCTAMGFRLTLDSTPGAGSTFTVHFDAPVDGDPLARDLVARE